MYSLHQKKMLRRYLDRDKPLGPVNGANIRNLEVSALLFESQNLIYKNIQKRPSIVVGRRGSGKTTFLKQLKYEKFQHHLAIDFDLDAAKRSISLILSKLPENFDISAESVSQLWGWLVWTHTASEIKKKFPETFSRRLEDENIWKRLKTSLGEAAFANLGSIIAAYSNSERDHVSLAGKILNGSSAFNAEALEQMSDRLCTTLAESKIKSIVLIDSIDQYNIHHQITRIVISGLLKFAGGFNFERGGPELRLCIPSELYHEFQNISSNPTKDFGDEVMLHWHSYELLSLTAHRYLSFLHCYSEEVNGDELIKLSELNFNDRKDSQKFWKMILPDMVTNRYGIKEDTLTYVLRHTHLLPRQLLLFLNKITALNIRNRNSPTKIKAECVVGALQNIENTVWGEVCNAYKALYPRGQEVCRTSVINLPLIFTESELMDVFHKHAKKRYNDHHVDFFQYRKMMIEIGCIGVVLDQNSDKYVRAQFEYNVPHRLEPPANALLCLHPMFCGVRVSNVMEDDTKFVLPVGSAADSLDFRDI